MVAVLVAVLVSPLAKIENPDQRAGGNQYKHAGHDEKIHPSCCRRAYGWQSMFHNLEMKSALGNLTVGGFRYFARCVVTNIHIQPLHPVTERMACQLKIFGRPRQIKIMLFQRAGY